MPQRELSYFVKNKVDVIISPSKFETFGNVPLETILFSNGKTPALISENMGVAEVYKNRRNQHIYN